MTVPKRRKSKARGRLRRTHYVAVLPTLSECPECHRLIIPHMACPSCRTYRGRELIFEKKKKEETPPPTPQARTA